MKICNDDDDDDDNAHHGDDDDDDDKQGDLHTDRLMNVLAVLLEAITIVSLLIHTAIVLLLVTPVQNTRA